MTFHYSFFVFHLIKGADAEAADGRVECENNKGSSHHLVPNSQGGWNKIIGSVDQVYSNYELQKDALDATQKTYHNQDIEIFIHGRVAKPCERAGMVTTRFHLGDKNA